LSQRNRTSPSQLRKAERELAPREKPGNRRRKDCGQGQQERSPEEPLEEAPTGVIIDASFPAQSQTREHDGPEGGDWKKLAALMNANFDKRKELFQLSEGNLRMVETARSVGASAKFTGSGGAIIGTYADEAMFAQLETAFACENIRVFKPAIV